MNQQLQKPVRAGRRAAFTLLEVLIVMVVLLIGIMAIVRIFPAGFITIRRTGELQAADYMAAQTLESIKNQEHLPDDILPVTPETASAYGPIPAPVVANAGVDTFDTLPGSLGDFTVNGAAPAFAPLFSDINRWRFVRGERVRIPVPTTTNAAATGGSVYLVQMGPLFMDPAAPDKFLKVYGAPLQHLEGSSLPQIVLTGPPVPISPVISPTQYAIDYDNSKISFDPALAGKTVTFSYSYYTNATGQPALGTNVGMTGANKNFVTITVETPPANTAGAYWQLIFKTGVSTDPVDAFRLDKPADFAAFKHGADNANRAFAFLPGGTGWSNDPYEYRVLKPNFGVNANIGLLAFNPTGYNFMEQTSTGRRALTARIDYFIFDNHILREDHVAPGQTPFVVKLNAPFPLQTGDMLPDQTQYGGLVRLSPGAPDIVVCDVNTGTVLPASAYIVDRHGATITLDPNYAPSGGDPKINLALATLRVFYRAQNDWGVEVQKASAQFVRAMGDANNPAVLTYNSYYYPPAGTTSGTKLYFRACQAGQTVVLGEYYMSDGTNVHRYANDALRISDTPLNAAGVAQPVVYIDVADLHPEAKTWNWAENIPGGSPTGTGLGVSGTAEAVRSVQGVSLNARIIWKTNTAWRQVNNSTALIAAPLQ